MSEFPPGNYPSVEEWLDIQLEEPKPNGHDRAGTSGPEWLDEFIARHGIVIKRREPWNGGLRLILAECPFNPEHGGTSAAFFVGVNGGFSFKCQHNSCADKRVAGGTAEVRTAWHL